MKWGADPISYKMGGRFGADPPHFKGPVRKGIHSITINLTLIEDCQTEEKTIYSDQIKPTPLISQDGAR